MDQNDLKFHVSELGESQKLQRINKKQSDFKASLQDLRSNNISPGSKRSSKQQPLPLIRTEGGKSKTHLEVQSNKKHNAHEIKSSKSPNNSLKRQEKISTSSYRHSSPKLASKPQIAVIDNSSKSDSEIEAAGACQELG